MKRPKISELAERRREVLKLFHKGWTQQNIACHLKIPQGTVSRDLEAIRKAWRDFPMHDSESVRLEQLRKIDLIEKEAWAAWDRSQQQRRTAQMARSKTGEQTRSSLHDSHGDPRYLREVARCVNLRAEMSGVAPPQGTARTGQDRNARMRPRSVLPILSRAPQDVRGAAV